MKKNIFLIVFIPCFANAQLELAKIFSDNMLFQRDKPIPVWGTSKPGKLVTVLFAKEKKQTLTKRDSTWSVSFPAKKARAIPTSITIISGIKQIELKNIIIGDIWLCIGQSNMEWPMNKEMHFQEEITGMTQPMLRLFNPVYAGKNTYNILFSDSITKNLTFQNFYNGQWQTCDSNSGKQMSAVAYYFGKKIAGEINIPVGLINMSIGGAPLETFINPSILKSSHAFSKKISGDWIQNNSLPVWTRERGTQNIGGLTQIPMDSNGNNHAFKPGFAYQSEIESILPLPIKGIICYQGESNAQEMERVDEYASLSSCMISDYRIRWKQPELPFYYVQLSSIDTLKYKGQLWPQFRDVQRTMLHQIPNSGMAVCSDIGFTNDVHPTNKKEVGLRLARWALNKTYKKNIIPSGPLPVAAIYEKGKLVISFEYTGAGLLTSDGKMTTGFSLDGSQPCDAMIENHKIVIVTNQKPAAVYYGWKPFSDGNLINSEKLPASTFKLIVK